MPRIARGVSDGFVYSTSMAITMLSSVLLKKHLILSR